jgi:hypothetical protein
MNTQDFRIGNKVFYEGKVQEISSLHSDNTLRLRENKESKCHGCYKVNRIEPIQLTEEILVNWCGAKEVMAKRGILKEFVLKTVRIEMSNSGNFYYKNSKTDLQYLHRLQNLFHSLRNEELPINHPSAK